MKPNWLFRKIPEGGLIPWGYGLAWHNWNRAEAVALPMPLHLILRVARSCYFRFMRLWRDEKWERLLRDAYNEGYTTGFARGQKFELELQVAHMLKAEQQKARDAAAADTGDGQ